jgi:hypothetical protein
MAVRGFIEKQRGADEPFDVMKYRMTLAAREKQQQDATTAAAYRERAAALVKRADELDATARAGDYTNKRGKLGPVVRPAWDSVGGMGQKPMDGVAALNEALDD